MGGTNAKGRTAYTTRRCRQMDAALLFSLSGSSEGEATLCWRLSVQKNPQRRRGALLTYLLTYLLVGFNKEMIGRTGRWLFFLFRRLTCAGSITYTWPFSSTFTRTLPASSVTHGRHRHRAPENHGRHRHRHRARNTRAGHVLLAPPSPPGA